jgi:hypothetical protein
MTSQEYQQLAQQYSRLDTRIDGLGDKIDDLDQSLQQYTLTVTRWVTLCEQCRPIVLGNGKDGMDKRVDRLERAVSDDREWRNKRFWTLVGGVPTLVAALVAGLFSWFSRS